MLTAAKGEQESAKTIIMRDIHLLTDYLAKLAFDDSWKWFAAGALGVANFVLPMPESRELSAVVFGFVCLDTVTGAVASSVTGERVSSAKAGRFLVKLLGYSSVVSVCSLTAKYAFPDHGTAGDARGFFVTVVLWAILLTEGISILENAKKMGIKLPRFIMKLLTDRLTSLNKEVEPLAEARDPKVKDRIEKAMPTSVEPHSGE